MSSGLNRKKSKQLLRDDKSVEEFENEYNHITRHLI